MEQNTEHEIGSWDYRLVYTVFGVIYRDEWVLSWDHGKENANSYLGFRVPALPKGPPTTDVLVRNILIQM